MSLPTHRTDVAVVGGGIAGMCAALAAREAGAEVALILEDRLGETGNTYLASGGLAALTGFDPEDSPALHLADMRRAARDLLFPDIAEAFIEESGAAIQRLAGLGVRFAQREGRPELFPVPGHSRPRSIRCEGGGTRHLMGPLGERVRERGVRVLEECTVTGISRSRRVTGLLYLDSAGGLQRIAAGAVVLATGGLGQLFRLTSNNRLATGSGYLLALRAGAVLTDLEFLQFTPTTLCHPPELRGVSTGGGLLAAPGARLINGSGERFMANYDPERMEASTRDIVARALHTEISEGRASEHGGVYLDISEVDRHAAEHVSGRFLRVVQGAAIDPFTTMVEVAPEMHFLMGGIAIDRNEATAVSGLFAAGEAAAGLHGATRLNSQALTEGAVFGHRAGLAAAAFADRAGDPSGGVSADADASAAVESFGIEVWRAEDPRLGAGHEVLDRFSLPAVSPEGGIAGGGGSFDEESFVERLHALMERGAGIVRSARSVAEALGQWEALAGEAGGLNRGVADPRRRFRLGGMLALSRLLLESARLRTESRGAHYRADQPEMDAAWTTHLCFSRA